MYVNYSSIKHSNKSKICSRKKYNKVFLKELKHIKKNIELENMNRVTLTKEQGDRIQRRIRNRRKSISEMKSKLEETQEWIYRQNLNKWKYKWSTFQKSKGNRTKRIWEEMTNIEDKGRVITIITTDFLKKCRN